MSSGSTAGPAFASICQRAGWKCGGTTDRYLKYEKAGDQFVGRTVCGLDINTEDFSVLPPHFIDPEGEGGGGGGTAYQPGFGVVFPFRSAADRPPPQADPDDVPRLSDIPP